MLQGYLSSMLPSELTVLFLFLLLLVLVIYLINAIAFYNLAVRYGVPSPWMSFVPILDVYQTGRFINAMLPDAPPLYQRFSHIPFCLLTLGGYAIDTIITLFVPQLENLWSIFYTPFGLAIAFLLYYLFFSRYVPQKRLTYTILATLICGPIFILYFLSKERKEPQNTYHQKRTRRLASPFPWVLYGVQFKIVAS